MTQSQSLGFPRHPPPPLLPFSTCVDAAVTPDVCGCVCTGPGSHGQQAADARFHHFLLNFGRFLGPRTPWRWNRERADDFFLLNLRTPLPLSESPDMDPGPPLSLWRFTHMRDAEGPSAVARGAQTVSDRGWGSGILPLRTLRQTASI